jgi:hypothetical protein
MRELTYDPSEPVWLSMLLQAISAAVFLGRACQERVDRQWGQPIRLALVVDQPPIWETYPAFSLKLQFAVTPPVVFPDVPPVDVPLGGDTGAVAGLPTTILSQKVFSAPTLIDSPSASFRVK